MNENHHKQGCCSIRPMYLVYLLLIVGGIYLIVYHGAHLYTILPFLIVLLCLLMHLFHNKHHGNNKGNQDKNNRCH
ncbi:MAG: DUF2933 domain-containing protein [Chlamydiales bacterium]|nr:DUF2933 domain-containing protein [Chlamydiales bacterium]